jgi:hypothetical protein
MQDQPSQLCLFINRLKLPIEKRGDNHFFNYVFELYIVTKSRNNLVKTLVGKGGNPPSLPTGSALTGPKRCPILSTQEGNAPRHVATVEQPEQ